MREYLRLRQRHILDLHAECPTQNPLFQFYFIYLSFICLSAYKQTLRWPGYWHLNVSMILAPWYLQLNDY